MKKRPTKRSKEFICMHHAGHLYQFPKKIAEKYRVKSNSISAEDLFSEINQTYTKPGALLRGIRVRENITQVELATMLKVTQSDVSQMENGIRSIGRTIAKRIEKLFDVNYRSFLS